jgi:hypothetical protein
MLTDLSCEEIERILDWFHRWQDSDLANDFDRDIAEKLDQKLKK